MDDIRNPKLMYVKAALFVAIGVVASTLILLEARSWKIALLLALAIWAFARVYYFLFYVIEYYIDGAYKFSGLASLLRFVLKHDAKENPE